MIARKHALQLTLPLATALVLLGCARPSDPADSTDKAASSAPAAVPATSAATDSPPPASGEASSKIGADALTGFLQATYGADASLGQPWWNADHSAQLHVCAHEAMAIDNRPHALLAVCGQLQDFGHASAGPNHFYLLATGPRGPEIVAQSRGQEYGGMGGSGDARVLRLGHDLYGFEVTSGFTGQGYTTGTRTLLLPSDGGFAEAASMHSHLDNTGHMEGCLQQDRCQPDDAYDIEFALQVDDSDPKATAYPLQVSESGEACSQPATASYRLSLDPASLSYDVPAALQRDSGCS